MLEGRLRQAHAELEAYDAAAARQQADAARQAAEAIEKATEAGCVRGECVRAALAAEVLALESQCSMLDARVVNGARLVEAAAANASDAAAEARVWEAKARAAEARAIDAEARAAQAEARAVAMDDDAAAAILAAEEAAMVRATAAEAAALEAVGLAHAGQERMVRDMEILRGECGALEADVETSRDAAAAMRAHAAVAEKEGAAKRECMTAEMEALMAQIVEMRQTVVSVETRRQEEGVSAEIAAQTLRRGAHA